MTIVNRSGKSNSNDLNAFDCGRSMTKKQALRHLNGKRKNKHRED